MKSSTRIFLAAAGTAAVLILATASARPAPEAENPAEIARLRAHFDTVLAELRAADVAHLDASQSAARATLIVRLEEYAAAGRFPHNHVRPGQRVPVFQDEHGTLCAMGYLIASTGRNDIVRYVTSTDNLVYIRQLADNALLGAWLDSTGLTLAEAARIQPAYEGGPCFCVTEPTPNQVMARRDYAVGSAASTALTGTALFFNVTNRVAAQPHRWGSWLGLASGSAQAILGSVAMSKPDWRRDVGFANIAIGGTSALVSAWRLRQPRPSTVTAKVSVQPYAAPDGAVGLSLSARM